LDSGQGYGRDGDGVAHDFQLAPFERGDNLSGDLDRLIPADDDQ
jgi:hypothetical protein